ncbi:MAG TPA: DUF2752 domain-containing protein [Vicinamibacteria bacterium]|nr:DUF2752 domain-containing protein [Vicinamibacteria bacterium]
MLLGVAALGAGTAALLRLDRLPFAICAFKAFTGLPCPTCGSTRAAAHLARLDLAGALAQNPLATAAAGALVAWGVLDLLLMLRGRALWLEVSPAVARALRLGAVAAIVANWAYLIAAGR